MKHIPNSLKGMHKMFDGRRYVAYAIVSTKSSAEETAERFREDGYLARYTETKGNKHLGGSGYLVWARRKQ